MEHKCSQFCNKALFHVLLEELPVGDAPSDVAAITHRLHLYSKMATASQNDPISCIDMMPPVEKYARLYFKFVTTPSK